MTKLLYFTAIMLSAVAAWYSIAGLAAIFAAAIIPIIVMGGVLEFAKLVVASWLYRSWKYVPLLMRTYFSIALVILMSLTSMGIFGFLSKAHLDQAVPTGDVASKIEILDQRIKTEKDNIESARNQLKQMDSQVDQTMSRSNDEKGAERSLQIRRSQQKERTALLSEIGSAQSKIAKLNEERAPIASELRKVEAEVGPIKYIAALIYGDNPDNTILEKAVRIVIIMIVIVFDPLAVLLLMAASMPIRKKEVENEITESVTEEASDQEDNNFTAQAKESVNKIKERFFNKFKRTTEEPSLEQRTTNTSSTSDSSRDDVGSEDRSPGVAVTTKDDIYVEDKISDWIINEPHWTINQPPSEPKIVEKVEYDSAGRIHKTHYIKQTTVDGKTIEEEVEDLQGNILKQ
jgi:hypothetical protein